MCQQLSGVNFSLPLSALSMCVFLCVCASVCVCARSAVEYSIRNVGGVTSCRLEVWCSPEQVRTGIVTLLTCCHTYRCETIMLVTRQKQTRQCLTAFCSLMWRAQGCCVCSCRGLNPLRGKNVVRQAACVHSEAWKEETD